MNEKPIIPDTYVSLHSKLYITKVLNLLKTYFYKIKEFNLLQKLM